MALFEGAKPVANSRSNSRLSVSQVMSPAERWIADPDLPELFEYSYGGPGDVVLSKGTIVAFTDELKDDYETGRKTFPITYANGSNNPIGVLPFNVYKKPDDRLLGNQPAILTHEYIELPYLVGIDSVYNLGSVGGFEDLVGDTNKEKLADLATKMNQLAVRMKMKWGCFYAEANEPKYVVKPGDFVVSDQFGKFIKLDLETATVKDLARVVGQVLAVETTDTGMPPAGWLKWVTPVVETGERADDNNKLPAPDAKNGYEFDPNYKFPLTGDYRSPGPWKDYQGIPGLTDGAVSGLGVGILPGWDFSGSIGAVRIALRY